MYVAIFSVSVCLLLHLYASHPTSFTLQPSSLTLPPSHSSPSAPSPDKHPPPPRSVGQVCIRLRGGRSKLEFS
ncbi:hypothetical protein E2C01_029738 [Portunus trituberculatus]|uniref:Secreted protein n=1 Tax=Portunus trituberculatus TaxID=210409 RepID=A0A5B7EVC0_PORTR|nr:hypothetical protein [Portunus trituberculatus]